MPDPARVFDSRERGVPPDEDPDLEVLSENSSDLVPQDPVPGETINNDFRHPIDSNSGATGTLIEEDGILYVQKCLHGDYYYEPCEIYGDTDQSTTIMAHSTDTWSLCETPPESFDYDEWLLEENRRMAYQLSLIHI